MPRKDGLPVYLQVTLNILENGGFGPIEILGNSIIPIMSLDQRWLVISC